MGIRNSNSGEVRAGAQPLAGKNAEGGRDDQLSPRHSYLIQTITCRVNVQKTGMALVASTFSNSMYRRRREANTL